MTKTKYSLVVTMLLATLLMIGSGLTQAIVTVENYIDVQIEDVKIDVTAIASEEEATMKVTLRNKSTFSGTVAVHVAIPSEIASICSVIGETSSLYFNAEQEKSLELKVKNIGDLNENKSSTLTLNVENQEPRITDSKTMPLSFVTVYASFLPNLYQTPTPQPTPTPKPAASTDWTAPSIMLIISIAIISIAVILYKK